MKHKFLLSTTLIASMLATSLYGPMVAHASEETVSVYQGTVTASADTISTSPADLNASSATTVAAAEADGLFSVQTNAAGNQVFINYAGGYQFILPDGLSVTDMGDASYCATLSNESTRIKIFRETLEVDAETYLGYSNRFLDNTDDFTLLRDDTIETEGRITHLLQWNRRALQRVENDRPHYAIIDIVENNEVYCLLITSTQPIDEVVDIDAVSESLETFTPTATGWEYPRSPRDRSHLTAETQEVYDTYFAEDAELTWGIFEPRVDGEEVGQLLSVQNTFQHHFDFVLCYSNIHEEYPENLIYNTLTRVWENNSIVELTLQTALYDPTTGNNVVYGILDGDYDAYLHAYAKDVARFGHPVLFRPFNEMNGDWCVYSAFWSARDCDTFVELYRYVYDIFVEEGADKNTLWVWNPNERSFPNFAWNAADNYYPGDEYVDIVGLTGYNTGDYYEGETWRTFTEIYDPIYHQMAPQYQQPLMITEFACSSYGGNKGEWIEDMFTSLDNYPRIKAAIWWDSADQDTNHNIARAYYIDNGYGVTKAFKKHLKEDDYTMTRLSAAALLNQSVLNYLTK